MKYSKDVIFFVVACIYFYTFPAHGETFFASSPNSPLNRITRQARPKACTTLQYKCKSGQCVASSVVCDGVRNCLDGSDELWEACESRYPNSCILPSLSQERNYIVNCDSSTAIKIFPSSKGDFVQELTLLSLSCNSGATPNGQLQSVCLKGKWTPQLSSCIKTCDPVPKANSAKLKCYINNEEVDCTRSHSPGTVIKPQCDANIRPNVDEAVCDESGKWNVNEFNCKGCGAKIQANPPFQYPWTVAIFLKEFSVLVCAGTIVSPTMVLTAASCFDEEKVKTPTNYVVVVGKKKRDFRTIDDKSQKNYAVRKIHIHQNYQADSSTNDIAIVELKDFINYNSAVYAACVDWDNALQIFVKPNTIGYVANYIVNETLGTAKHTFYIPIEMELFFESNMELNYIPQSSCIASNPAQELRKLYIGEDKFCVKRQNDQPIIIVDKGTGYFIEYQNKYYLIGTASGMFAPYNTFRVFTDVLKHAAWAKSIINAATTLQIPLVPQISAVERKPETFIKNEVFTYDSLKIDCSNGDLYMEFTGGCTLPNKGLYNIDYQVKCPEGIFQSYCNHSTGGAPIPQFTSLEYKCKDKYYSYGPEASASVCFQGAWQPPISQCGRICSPLKPQNVVVKCTYEGREINCDNKLIVNTEVTPISCFPEYKRNTTTNNGPIYCRENGQWSGQLLKCIPICGHSSRTKIKPTIHGGDPVMLGEFPWHAAVYEKPINNTLICGATILSPYTLLSAAHCFYDAHQDRYKNPLNYEIGVSKVTRDRYTRDSETTQFYEVETLLFNGFQGRKLRFQRDIVIIVTKTKMSFNTQVSPICLFKESSIKIASNAILDVAGWGVDETGKRTGSPILKVTHLPYISFDECVKVAPPSVSDYLVTEKFCTGLNVTTLDEGDSGGGLVVQNSVDLAYYLVGIVSFRAAEGLAISLNTYVLDYLSWITSKLTEVHIVKNEMFE